MILLIKFENVGGQTVWINPMAVQTVTASGEHDGTKITLTGGTFVTVKMGLEQAASRLQLADVGA